MQIGHSTRVADYAVIIGKGYPEGKAGSEIPLCAQILAVCDSFDAMTSSRPYRPGMDLGKALFEIQANRGAQWSEEVVDTFMKCIRKGLIILDKSSDIRNIAKEASCKSI